MRKKSDFDSRQNISGDYQIMCKVLYEYGLPHNIAPNWAKTVPDDQRDQVTDLSYLFLFVSAEYLDAAYTDVHLAARANWFGNANQSYDLILASLDQASGQDSNS